MPKASRTKASRRKVFAATALPSAKMHLQNALGKFGYQLRKTDSIQQLGYESEDLAISAIAVIRPYSMLTRERLITLYQQVKFCEDTGIVGDFVECGVWKGGSVALMALGNLRHGTTRRRIHLFDSFTDICEPDESVDGPRAIAEAERWGQSPRTGKPLTPMGGFYDFVGGAGTLEGNKRLLEKIVGYDPENLKYHVGWFQDTLPKDIDSIGDIAILRLDGDWYASTKVCLDYLYDKVVKGGFVIIDDYACYEGCRKAVDEFRSERGISDFMHHVDQECRYWIKT